LRAAQRGKRAIGGACVGRGQCAAPGIVAIGRNVEIGGGGRRCAGVDGHGVGGLAIHREGDAEFAPVGEVGGELHVDLVQALVGLLRAGIQNFDRSPGTKSFLMDETIFGREVPVGC